MSGAPFCLTVYPEALARSRWMCIQMATVQHISFPALDVLYERTTKREGEGAKAASLVVNSVYETTAGLDLGSCLQPLSEP